MSALKLVMTTTGLGRFTSAQAGDDIDLTIARVGLTDAEFVAAPSLTALPGEFRRLSTVSGSVEAQNIVHMTVTDDAEITYSVRGFGLFLTDGTLFAAYSQTTRIAEKSIGSMLALAIDIAFPAAGVDQITFGSTNFLNPPASTERKGVVELATLEEANASDPVRVTTGAIVKAMIADALAAVGQALDGIMSRTVYGSGLVKGGGDLTANRTFTVDGATAADVRSGTRTDVAVTPAALRGAGTATFTENGRRVSPDGFVEIWGVSPARATEGPFSLQFDPPFPNACFGIATMTRNVNQTVEGLTSIQEVGLSPSRADLFAQNHTNNLTEVGGFRWRAWGY